MFRTDRSPTEIIAHRIARVWFGSILLAGGLVMLGRDALPWENAAGGIMVTSWVVAFAAYAIVSRRVPKSDHRADDFARSGLIMPTIGIVTMLPLFIHLPFALAMGGVRGYDGWVDLSYWFAGPTTVVTAALCAWRAYQLAADRALGPTMRVGMIYAIGVTVACVPFAVFVLPPIIVALTGLPFIALLGYQERLATSERGESSIPRAIACAA